MLFYCESREILKLWSAKYTKIKKFSNFLFIYLFIFFIHVCPPQGWSHYNGRWATEFMCNREFIPGTETLALLKSP